MRKKQPYDKYDPVNRTLKFSLWVFSAVLITKIAFGIAEFIVIDGNLYIDTYNRVQEERIHEDQKPR
jgi:hypothetical protein